MAFDSEIFSFKECVKDRPIYVLITNPKNMQFKSERERAFKRSKYSTNIRLLVFAKFKVKSVKIYIDGVFVGDAHRSDDVNVPLYLLKWNPNNYVNDKHAIKAVVEVCCL